MTIRHSIAMISAALLFSISASAQDANNVALPFTRTGISPVTEAMGGTGMLSAAAESGIAAVPFSDMTLDASGMISMPFSDGKPTYGAMVGSKIGSRFGIMATAVYGQDEPYDTFDDSGNATGSFSPTRLAISGGASIRIIDWLSAGVNIRYASEKLYTDATTSAVSADAVLMGKWKGIKAAAGLMNIGGYAKDSAGNEFSLATSASGALGYANRFGKHGIETEVKFDYYLPEEVCNPVEISAGAAYTFNGIVSIRGGYHYAGQKSVVPSFASTGIGVKFLGVHLDAALRINKKSGNSICAGLGYQF